MTAAQWAEAWPVLLAFGLGLMTGSILVGDWRVTYAVRRAYHAGLADGKRHEKMTCGITHVPRRPAPGKDGG